MSDKDKINEQTDEPETDQQDAAPDDARREFLKRFGTYAAATPPTVTALLLPSKESFAQYAPGPDDGGGDGPISSVIERFLNAFRALLRILLGNN